MICKVPKCSMSTKKWHLIGTDRWSSKDTTNIKSIKQRVCILQITNEDNKGGPTIRDNIR